MAKTEAAQRATERPWVVALFVATLIALQLGALVVQFQRGFMPLRAAPRRVPLSWDMFSISIERCGISWDPPLAIGRGQRTLRSLAPALEWDPVYDDVADYLMVARLTCRLRARHAHVTCVTARGFEQHDIDCP